MGADAKVTWLTDKVMAQVMDKSDQLTDEAAETAAIYAMENVKDGGHVDTEFMANSFYHVSPLQDTYGSLLPDGLYTSSKTGRGVKREKAGRQTPADEHGAIVANAAPYFIYIEARYHVLYRAVEAVAAEMGAIAERVGKL